MRLRIVSLLLVAACASPALGGDKKKSEAPTIQVIVLREGDAQVLPPPPGGGGSIVVVPGQIPPPAPVAATLAPVETHTPCVNCSEGGSGHSGKKGADSCPPRLAAKVFPKFDKPRPGLDCDGCSTFRCEWRFLFGGCRAFHNEGPFMPRWPDNCPCGAKVP